MSSGCPHCRADLAYEVDGCEYSRVIGYDIPGVYDGVLFWECPFCGGRWQRWEPGTRLHAAAEPYVNASREGL